MRSRHGKPSIASAQTGSTRKSSKAGLKESPPEPLQSSGSDHGPGWRNRLLLHSGTLEPES